MRPKCLATAIRTALFFSATASGLAMAAQQGETPDGQTGDIERIIVTGQKIARTLQETTTSVAVITADQIDTQNITNFTDSLDTTANAAVTPWGGFSIRGIDGQNVSGGGNSYLASVYVDGAPLPRYMITGGGFSTWDANQVEILRGPQSTLQGRNALAGAVVMTTTAPSHEWQAKYRLQAGEYGQQEAAVAVGGGLIEDQLAFRFSGEKKQLDGFNDNLTRDETSDYRDDELYRLKFLLTPSNMPDLSVQLGLTHATNTRGQLNVEVPADGSPYDQRHVTYNDKKEQFYTTDLATLTLDYQLSDNWELTTVSTYSDVDNGYDWDADDSAADIGQRFWDARTTTLSQELRLTFEYDKLQGIVGAYYSREKVDSDSLGTALYYLSTVGLSSDFLQAAYGLDAGTADLVIGQYAGFDPARTRTNSGYNTQVSSYALFTDFVYQVNDSWEIYGGLRWDRERQENSAYSNLVITNLEQMPQPDSYLGTPFEAIMPLIEGINAQIVGLQDQANGNEPLVDASFNTLLPKLGVSYHWTEDLTSSFTVQRGYRSGGVGSNAARAQTYQYDPEYTDNYELALRSTWLDGDLIVNANLFYIDWTDQQVNVQLSENTFDTETRNAGKSTVRGFELESTYHATEQLKLYGALGQANSEFTDFTVEIPSAGGTTVHDLAGRRFADAPEWTANVGMTYVADNGFFADINANYADSAPAEVNPYFRGDKEGDPDFDLYNDSRTLVNMQLGYEWQDIGIYLIGRNIFDKEYLRDRDSKFVIPGSPRQFSLSLRGSF